VSLTVERVFHLASRPGQTGGVRRVVEVGPEPESPPPAPTKGRIPRISKLMALAIHCDQLLRSGQVPDASVLADLAHVTQPRMTQILNLTLLAPDTQERLLFLDPIEEGRPEVSEKRLRRVCALVEWDRQREMARMAGGSRLVGGVVGRSCSPRLTQKLLTPGGARCHGPYHLPRIPLAGAD